MSDGSDSTTRTTLLRRVRNRHDKTAWEEFVERYAPKIFSWCRMQGLQDADSEEVAQEVLTKLITAMERFQYDKTRGSFRGWLKVVTQNAVNDLTSKQACGRGNGVRVLLSEELEGAEARQTLLERLRENFDLELQEEAMYRVRLRVQSNTWEAFFRRSLHRQAAKDVADALNMSVAAVNMANRRVQLLLRAEVKELDTVS